MMGKPKCIIVTGRPGSGKTTLSKRLGALLRMPVISRDEIKEGYVRTCAIQHDQLPPDTNGVVSDLFFQVVHQLLAGQVSVVIEAAFQHRVWAQKMDRIQAVGDPLFVICEIDEMLAARRHLQRGLDDPAREFFHGDKHVSIFREKGVMAPPEAYEAPTFDLPAIHVSTAGEYTPGLDAIVKRILLLDA